MLEMDQRNCFHDDQRRTYYQDCTYMRERRHNHPIEHKEVIEAHKTLGTRMCPTGDMIAEANYLKNQSCDNRRPLKPIKVLNGRQNPLLQPVPTKHEVLSPDYCTVKKASRPKSSTPNQSHSKLTRHQPYVPTCCCLWPTTIRRPRTSTPSHQTRNLTGSSNHRPPSRAVQ